MSQVEVKQSNLAQAELITRHLELSHNDYVKIVDLISNEFHRGLKSTKASSIKMFLTFVRSLPNKQERGQYLALDLGGTNFRILLVEFSDDHLKIVDCFSMEIPENVRKGPGSNLFDFIAEQIVAFSIRHQLAGVRIALGFTFSFPLQQYGLAAATLVTWTKQFSCPGVVNFDVVRLLKDAIKRKAHKAIPYVDVVAIINDTTGTLIAGSFIDKKCLIGLIVGTGCNACYLEQIRNIEKWPFNYNNPKQVVVNTELGAFGDNGVLDFIRTKWDYDLDKDSINPTKQIYEKMVAGLYIPELLHRALLTLIEAGVLFNGKTPSFFLKPNSIMAENMSTICMDLDQDNLVNTRNLVKSWNIDCEISESDLQIIHMVTNRIIKRASYLIAVAICSLMARIPNDDIGISYDGSLINYHPTFRLLVEEKVKQLNGELSTKKFRFVQVKDGSGIGAAIIAAVCYREKRPTLIKSSGKVYEITSLLQHKTK